MTESEVLDELFGASEEEFEQIEQEKDNFGRVNVQESQYESENESELESEKELTKNKRKSSAKKKITEEEGQETGEKNETDDKILEARRDFEEALSKLKGGRRKRDNDSDSVNYDDMAVAFINKMYEALRKDDEAVKAEKPALAKLKMLDEVTEMLTKKHLQEIFLDNQVLDALKKWLEPNIRGQLSIPTIRKRILELLQILPIETVHLRESGIGRIVMFYYQRKRESLEIRKLAGDLITTWSRPILGTSLNYTEMIQTASTTSSSVQHSNDEVNASHLKRLQSDDYKKMVRSGALEKDSNGGQRYRQLINRQKNRKRE